MTRGYLVLVMILFSTACHVYAADPYGTRLSPSDRVERLMQTRFSFDVAEITIQDLPVYLRQRFRLTVMIDETALQDEGIDTSITARSPIGMLKLETFLDLTLQPQGLEFVVQGGVLIITSQASADEAFETWVYAVDDLVAVDSERFQYDNLIVALYEGTSGPWEMDEGVGGTISPVYTTESLVIRQTRKGHQEVNSILTALRAGRGLPPVPGLRASPEEDPPVADFSDERMTGGVPELGAAASWLVPKVYEKD